jgi:predicted GIY-YIG superfamily endonuclease
MFHDPGPPWLAQAQRVARAFSATTRRARRAGHSVYIVLLHDPRRTDPWGLYVGQTSRDPDLRFDQHKAGYKASGAVRRFGVRLLPDLVAHLNPMRAWESLDLEAALAQALTQAGVAWVEGGH